MERRSKGRLILALAALVLVVVGAVVGIVLGARKTSPGEVDTQQVDALVACIAREGTRDECEATGCFWKNLTASSPKCWYKQASQTGYGYRLNGEIENTTLGYRMKLSRIKTTPLYYKNSTPIDDVKLEVEFHDISRLRLKFTDFHKQRYEVSQQALDIPAPSSPPDVKSRLYDVRFVREPQFGIEVVRKSNGVVIFNTALPGFTFTDQYLQLTTRLSSSHVYGFGEHNHLRYKHDMNWKRWPIFTRDQGPYADPWNLYGHQTFYMNVETSGNANGVFLKNSNAMDIVLQPDPYPGISYQVIGGVLDFFLFLGPTPENVVQQYNKAVGFPVMPPYWSLGFQLCRWGYNDTAHVREVLKRQREAAIPQDVQYVDIDYTYEKLMFTYNRQGFRDLPELVQELHDMGQKLILILDPGIGTNPNFTTTAPPNNSYPPLEDGEQKDIFVKNPNKTGYLVGEVWPESVYYPDFTKPSTNNWWRHWVHDFFFNQKVEYDALWVDMNEPANFRPGSFSGACDDNKWNRPPYIPRILDYDKGHLYTKTLCMDAVHDNWGDETIHYNVHSLYGHSMAMSSYDVLRKLIPSKRPLVLTRSTFAGTGKYAVHWLGDNASQWPHLAWSIPGMLEFNLFGFPYVGADICGFWGDTTEELCTRWMQVGAFYPFSRNHNAQNYPRTDGFKDQDPAVFGEPLVSRARDVLNTRYKLLPYLYTLFHYAHTEGSTVARPLLHEFPGDPTTYDIDTQFMWGAAFLISPALKEKQVEVKAYLPKARWYDYFTGQEIFGTGQHVTLRTPLDHINLHVRGGYVIPWQEPANTTVIRLVHLCLKHFISTSHFKDMNEPANFRPGSFSGACDDNKWNRPPYIPRILDYDKGHLYTKTLCMDAVHDNWGEETIHYNVHSLYGHSMAMSSYDVLRKLVPSKRPLVLTRSTFAGTGKYAVHWLGDNASQWPHLAWSIPGMLEFNLFGFPYVGADICGFWGDTTEELCTRWMQVGAFYPFSRNHNAQNYPRTDGFKDQDPAVFGEPLVSRARDVLNTRYKLLPYLYTLFHYAHTEGSTVARPLLHEFPGDPTTYDIDTQFMWGAAFLISPALKEKQVEVKAYLPKARWYDYFTGQEILGTGQHVTLRTPLDHINLHVRGGYVIPWQEPANTTVISRTKPMGLIVAVDEHSQASGQLFWDDGESYETYQNGNYLLVNFTVTGSTLSIAPVHSNTSASAGLVFDTVEIYGLRNEPTFMVNGAPKSTGVEWSSSYKVARLKSLNLPIETEHNIRWTIF
ncbi:maltase-glucoamylase, intestinal [Lingula anatina]|uniref:alpha-glucosidase n=1 Tax=Lingula anatina TaxID=7574 RepID=A0A1S3JFW9_LINAN|nr:maltase-glucoamylase, intestinal [Lingula anatina]|eukprot:XP_013409300.1 maltase-glucoamylase, intestinal [Lingula anatina]